VLELGALVAAVGVEFQQEGIHPEQCAPQQITAIAILHIGSMNDRVQQQALRVYQEMTLLAVDFLARIVAIGSMQAPLFQRS
jgi:hypothetical protein